MMDHFVLLSENVKIIYHDFAAPHQKRMRLHRGRGKLSPQRRYRHQLPQEKLALNQMPAVASLNFLIASMCAEGDARPAFIVLIAR